MMNKLQSWLLRREIDQLDQQIKHHREDRELHQQAINVKREMIANAQRRLLANGSMA